MPVYVIRAGETEMVKIGWADRDVEARRLDLQTAHWLPLKIIRVIHGPRAIEGRLHRKFADRRVLGEWYRLHPDMLTIEGPAAATPALLAIEIAGGPSKLAEKLGVVPSAITQWTQVPSRHLPMVEHITGIPGRELRPDLYPVPEKSAA